MSRRERRGTFYIASGDDLDRVRHTRPQIQLLRGGTSVFTRYKNNLPLDSLYSEEISSYPHNVQRKVRNRRPFENHLSQKMDQNISSENIPSTPSINEENRPRPLFSPETLERLRSNYRVSDNRYELNMTYVENEEEDSNWSLPKNDQLESYTDILREKEVTKQKVDEIIRVAQALREKLEREEAISQMSDMGLTEDDESNLDEPQSSPVNRLQSQPSMSSEDACQDVSEIPRLMDLKPKIPSLMDVFVPPPTIGYVMQENHMMPSMSDPSGPRLWDVCWNCDEPGHGFSSCTLPKMRKFCYSCGARGFIVNTCPYCNLH